MDIFTVIIKLLKKDTNFPENYPYLEYKNLFSEPSYNLDCKTKWRIRCFVCFVYSYFFTCWSSSLKFINDLNVRLFEWKSTARQGLLGDVCTGELNKNV